MHVIRANRSNTSTFPMPWRCVCRTEKDHQPTSSDHFPATCRCRESNPYRSSCTRGPRAALIMNCPIQFIPGAVARSEASSLGMQAAPSSIPTSGTFFRGDLVMKTFLRPFSLFRWFKKSSCQLLAKECALSTGKLPRRLAQEQCG